MLTRYVIIQINANTVTYNTVSKIDNLGKYNQECFHYKKRYKFIQWNTYQRSLESEKVFQNEVKNKYQNGSYYSKL